MCKLFIYSLPKRVVVCDLKFLISCGMIEILATIFYVYFFLLLFVAKTTHGKDINYSKNRSKSDHSKTDITQLNVICDRLLTL